MKLQPVLLLVLILSLSPLTYTQNKVIKLTDDNKEAVSVTDGKYTHGLAGLGSDFNYAEFMILK